MTVIRAAERPGGKLATDWLPRPLARRPKKVAVVAPPPAFAGTSFAGVGS
jgi:hypothetical protein